MFPVQFTFIQFTFFINLSLSLLYGMLTGIERELKNKPAGISTHCFVIAGAMIFTHISRTMFPAEPTRIAAQIISGVGFLGAGIIMKLDGGKVENLTTAASVWYSAAIGMSLGYNLQVEAFLATLFGILVPRIPNVHPGAK
ncbi:MgtC/SapB family protein [Patescibacteria group bacterium]